MSDESVVPSGEPVAPSGESVIQRITNPKPPKTSRPWLVTLASSLGAVAIALVIAGVLLAITGKNPFEAYSKMLDAGLEKDKLYETVQRATPLMIAAVAVASTTKTTRAFKLPPSKWWRSASSSAPDRRRWIASACALPAAVTAACWGRPAAARRPRCG